VIFGANAAGSALLGGMVCIIPNAYFARKLFKYQGARSAKQIVNSFYKGEAIKMILSIALFTAVFVYVKITPLAFFASYIMVLMTHWFAPLIIVNKQNRPESD
jgi:ATP synthase protein I